MIYLIRHTTPAIAHGMCYGQTDLDVTDSFDMEAAGIRQHLADSIGPVYSSPLKRCTRLARKLFPDTPLLLVPGLMEIHCGEWEMRAWDDLPPEEVNPWMADFVQVRIPGGESYIDLHTRVTQCWNRIAREHSIHPPEDMAIIAHGGVLRSILSEITGTPLIDSFKKFSLHYGCVVRAFEREGKWQYETIWNPPPPEKEQHKPKTFYR